MNILFTRFSLESAYGGAEVQTLSLMKGLKEKGHEMIFLGSCPVLLEQTEKLKIKNVKCKIELDGKDIRKLTTGERAKAGLFLAMQSPIAIPA